LKSILNEVDKSFIDLKRITFDADTLIYREDKILNKFAKKIEGLNGDEKLAHTLINKINEVKENMKTVTRKLFVVARAEEKDMFSKSIDASINDGGPISKQMKKLGVEIDEVGKILEHLKIDDIDDIVKNSEDELIKLKKIELEAVAIIKKLEGYLTDIKNRFYLLQDEIQEKLKDNLDSSEKKFDKIKQDITKNAEKLFKDINIAGDIPSVIEK